MRQFIFGYYAGGGTESLCSKLSSMESWKVGLLPPFRTKHRFVVHHTEYAVSLWGLGFLNVAYFPYYITVAWANIIWLSLPWESWDLGSQAHADPLGIVVVTSNKVRLLWTRNLNVFLNEFISIISFFSSLLCNSYQVSPTPSQIYSLFYFNYYCYTHT